MDRDRHLLGLAFGFVPCRVRDVLTEDLLNHRGARIIKSNEAAICSSLWLGSSLLSASVIWSTMGTGPAIAFTAAWPV